MFGGYGGGNNKLKNINQQPIFSMDGIGFNWTWWAIFSPMLVVGTVHVPCSCPCAPYDMYSWAISRRQKQTQRLSKNWRRECAWFTGWWFGTFVIFPYIGNVIKCHHPNWRSPSFFRGGRYTTNQYIFVEPLRGAQLNKRPHSLLFPSSEIVSDVWQRTWKLDV